jgi:putative acetyltransferase
MVEIIIANTETEYAAAAILFKEYAAWLNIDLGFQKFEEELLLLKEMYAFPVGAILLSKHENIFTGCVAVRKKENDIAELKRMFIKENYRNEGIGALLLQKALEIAAKLQYKKIRLDTLDTMTPAINLYKKFGFYEIEPYYFNPEKNAVFFEKLL